MPLGSPPCGYRLPTFWPVPADGGSSCSDVFLPAFPPCRSRLAGPDGCHGRGVTASGAPAGDDTPVLLHPKGEIADEFNESTRPANFAKLRDAYFETRLLSGDQPLTVEQAAQAAPQGHQGRGKLAPARAEEHAAARRVGGAWTSIGPDPTVQVGRTSNTFAGRLRPHRRPGGPQGRHDHPRRGAGRRVDLRRRPPGRGPRGRQDTDTQAVGALAIAPSNDKFVYMGSGEGALSGDSYYGDGVYRSNDGGMTWIHVSGTFFQGISVSDIVVDPTNANHLYIATLRGRGGVRRTTPPSSQQYGIWESTNGGTTWTLRKVTTERVRRSHRPGDGPDEPAGPLGVVLGRQDLPRRPTAARPGPSAMGNLPHGNFLGRRHPVLARPLAPGRRSARRRSTPASTTTTPAARYHPARLWQDRPTTARPGPSCPPAAGDQPRTASSTTARPSASTTTCVAPDPKNPNIVYVEGSYGYDQSPAVRRHLPQHRRWRDLEEPRLRPAPGLPRLRVRPEQLQHVVIGNDGGVWQSHNRRWPERCRRPAVAVDWKNLNGTVDPTTGALVHSTGPADHPVHQHRHRAHDRRASTGAAPRTTARSASPTRQRPLVRPAER